MRLLQLSGGGGVGSSGFGSGCATIFFSGSSLGFFCVRRLPFFRLLLARAFGFGGCGLGGSSWSGGGSIGGRSLGSSAAVAS